MFGMTLQNAASLCLPVVMCVRTPLSLCMYPCISGHGGWPHHAGPWQGQAEHHERVQGIQEGHSHA